MIWGVEPSRRPLIGARVTGLVFLAACTGGTAVENPTHGQTSSAAMEPSTSTGHASSVATRGTAATTLTTSESLATVTTSLVSSVTNAPASNSSSTTTSSGRSETISSTSAHDAGVTSSTRTGSNASSTASAMSSTSSGFNPADGDRGDACAPAPGGPPCTPGLVACGDASTCSVPGNACCVTNESFCQTGGGYCYQGYESTCVDCSGVCCSGFTFVCQPATAACNSGARVTCNEAADCPPGQACYFESSADGGTTLSCKPIEYTPCVPTPDYYCAQACRSTAECVSPARGCSQFQCRDGFFLQACEWPGEGCGLL